MRAVSIPAATIRRGNTTAKYRRKAYSTWNLRSALSFPASDGRPLRRTTGRTRFGYGILFILQHHLTDSFPGGVPNNKAVCCMTLRGRRPAEIPQGIPQMFHREGGKSRPDRVMAFFYITQRQPR